MRSSRMLAIGVTALTLGVAATIAGAAIPAEAASTVRFVALGDSYSSGVGAGGTSGPCGQSPNAFPKLWAVANSVASFTFAACSGARTGDVMSSQLSSLSTATTLVSITIGGNDAGFPSIMETCVLKSTSSCENAVAAGEKYAAGTLPGLLDATLARIRAHAPNAKVIVVGYPDFYDLSAWFCIGLSGADHRALDAGINELDGVIAAAAARNGDAFADVRAQFSGHELCDGAHWLTSVTLPIGNSYHPTSAGQKNGYLPVFSAAAARAGQ
ncbi:MAG TPA: SGNH/GDSL hydrolase family protein [Trebonia sp.]